MAAHQYLITLTYCKLPDPVRVQDGNRSFLSFFDFLFCFFAFVILELLADEICNSNELTWRVLEFIDVLQFVSLSKCGLFHLRPLDNLKDDDQK